MNSHRDIDGTYSLSTIVIDFVPKSSSFISATECSFLKNIPPLTDILENVSFFLRTTLWKVRCLLNPNITGTLL